MYPHWQAKPSEGSLCNLILKYQCGMTGDPSLVCRDISSKSTHGQRSFIRAALWVLLFFYLVK